MYTYSGAAFQCVCAYVYVCIYYMALLFSPRECVYTRDPKMIIILLIIIQIKIIITLTVIILITILVIIIMLMITMVIIIIIIMVIIFCLDAEMIKDVIDSLLFVGVPLIFGILLAFHFVYDNKHTQRTQQTTFSSLRGPVARALYIYIYIYNDIYIYIYICTHLIPPEALSPVLSALTLALRHYHDY